MPRLILCLILPMYLAAASVTCLLGGDESDNSWLAKASVMDGRLRILCPADLSQAVRPFAQMACALNPALRVSIKEGQPDEFSELLNSSDFDLTIADSPGTDSAKSIPFAFEGLLLAMNPDSKASNLTADQFKDVMERQIKDWSVIGGDAIPVELAIPDSMMARKRPASADSSENPFGIVAHPSSCQCEECQKRRGNPSFGSISSYWIKEPERMTQTMALDIVRRNPSAMALVNISHLSDAGLKLVSIDGVAPEIENLRSGKYRLAKTRWIVVPNPKNRLALDVANILAGKAYSTHLLAAGLLPYDQSKTQTPDMKGDGK